MGRLLKGGTDARKALMLLGVFVLLAITVVGLRRDGWELDGDDTPWWYCC
jgi:hypothetical protein